MMIKKICRDCAYFNCKVYFGTEDGPGKCFVDWTKEGRQYMWVGAETSCDKWKKEEKEEEE